MKIMRSIKALNAALDALLKPRSIAVIGASRERHKFGRIIFENLLSYHGRVYPINPNARTIAGRRCYPSILDVPTKVDLAIVAIPAPLTPNALADCAKKRVKAAIVISAGFSEIGNTTLEKKLLSAADGVRILGPNVLGVYNAWSGLDTLFNPHSHLTRPPKGCISIISQSGAFGAALLDWAAGERVGVGKFLPLGNASDINEIDLLHYLSNDENTKVVAIYLEGSRLGRRLLHTLRAVALKKPIVLLKAGKTPAGERAVLSHTASMAGSYEVWRAALKQAGVYEAHTLEDLFDAAEALALAPKAKGRRALVITNGGGFGVVMSDELILRGIELPQLSKRCIASLKESKILPPHATLTNPIDLTGDSTPEMYRAALKVAIEERTDAIIVIVLPQVPNISDKIVNVLIEASKTSRRRGKPLLACIVGGGRAHKLLQRLESAGVPCYPTPTRCASALAALMHYTKVHHAKY